jgi:hypothetical protein
VILTIPSMYPRPDRSHQNDPAVFGNACETWRSTFTENKPGTPQVLLIEQSSRDELLPHFHASDQFQVFIQGEGKLGRHDLTPAAIHYTNRYTGYGPIVASGSDFQYFVLRPSFDPLGFGQYLWKPELREKLRAHPGPKRVLTAQVAIKSESELAKLEGTSVEHLFGIESGSVDEGLLAEVVNLGARSSFSTPGACTGGGQVVLVLEGSIVYGGVELGVRSALAITSEEGAVSFASGARGAQALVLQYPRRERSTPQ